MRRAGRKEEGFTLIELAIALAILGILVAIAVPTYLNVRKTAYDSEAKQNLGAIRSVAWSHFLEHDEWAADITELGFDGDEDGYATDNWKYSVVDSDPYTLCAQGTTDDITAGRNWVMVLDEEGGAKLYGPQGSCTVQETTTSS